MSRSPPRELCQLSNGKHPAHSEHVLGTDQLAQCVTQTDRFDESSCRDGEDNHVRCSVAAVDVAKQLQSEKSLDDALGDNALYKEHSRGLFLRILNRIVPHGGFLSGVFNLASVTLGAGIISIPAAFNTSGIIMASVYLLVITILTVYSINLLATASQKTGLCSFEALARELFGRGGDIFSAMLMCLLCFGGAFGYIIAIGSVIQVIFNHDGLPAFLRTSAGHRTLTSVIWVIFILPLCLPKQVNSLRYASAIGICFILLFVLSIVVHSSMVSFKDGLPSDLVLVRTGNSIVSGLAIFCFSYLCQVNCLKIMYESTHRSVAKLTKQACCSCAVCGTLYFLTGIFGYAEFGSQLTDNILTYYNPYKDVIFFVCYMGIIVKLCAAFALNMSACRTSVFQVMRWDVDTMPYWKHTIISLTFSASALVFGLFVKDVNVVFALAGSLCGGFIAFIFPALFVMYSGNWSLHSVGIWHYLATYFLLICGVFAVVFGTGSSIYSIVTHAG